MTEFPGFKTALRTWVNEALDRLSRDSVAEDRAIDRGHWRRDSDGVFRDRERYVAIWDRDAVSALFQLPSWAAVLDVIHADQRLNRQVGAFIGTAQGGQLLEPLSVGRRALPRPDELNDPDEAFERRYAELESFLAADEIEYTVIWALPGLVSEVLPVRLEANLELDAMSDRELGHALDTEIVRPSFARHRLLMQDAEYRTCVRYRYGLAKTLGSIDADETFRAVETQLQDIEGALKEALAIVLPDAVGIAGRFTIVTEEGSPLAGGMSYIQATLPRGLRFRRTKMNERQAAELGEVWAVLHQQGLLSRYKGLALALRRLSYQAQREQPVDEMLDTMIAAEALYLTDLGNEAERGELRYRLSLRTALWAKPEQVGFTKREVFRIMKTAYDARSAIAHGGTPKPEDMKVRGQKVSLAELAKTTKLIVVAGCRAALAEAAASDGQWPPDWDGLALGDMPD